MLTFGNLCDLGTTVDLKLYFTHRNSSVLYEAKGLADGAGCLQLAPRGAPEPAALWSATSKAYDDVFQSVRSPYLTSVTCRVADFMADYAVYTLHLAKGNSGALRKRALTRLEVAFGDDQEVYLRGVLSDPLSF